MKVLIVATVVNFITSFEKNDISILKKMGYEVHCATNYSDAEPERLYRLEQLGIIKHPINFCRSPYDKRNYIAYKQLRKLLKQEKFDLIHCHTPMGGVLARVTARKYRKTGTKIIYTAHGFHFFKGAPLKNWIIYYPIEKILSRWTDVIVTINHEDYSRAKRKFHAGKVEYIPGVGVDTNKFAVCSVDKVEKRRTLDIDNDDFILLSVGELSERKNQRIVIEALHKLRMKNDLGDIVYLLVGEGPLLDKYKRMIKDFGLKDHVKILGYRSDIDELCEIADCFVHPSIQEGLGIAPLEAMASGLPLISADVNGIKDYTSDGISGCCIDPQNVDEMVAAIQKMYNDKEFREKCAGNNLKTAKKFDICGTEEIMKKIVGGCSHLRAMVIRQKKRMELGISNDDYVVISIGELNDNKNHQVVLRAIARISDNQVKYIIVGKGSNEEYLLHMKEQLGLSDRIKILGFRTDIKELLLASDIFAFPSKREGLGLAAIEAMCIGLPLITSNIHGINDYSMNQVTGYKCASNDAESISVFIEKIKNNSSEYRKMSQNNRNMALNYDISVTHKTMCDIYDLIRN